MSNEELIGRFGEQYRAAKESLKSLQAEARLNSQKLKSLSDFLNQMAAQSSPTIEVSKHVAEFPTQERLTKLLTEIAASTQQMQLAQAELKRLGIEVK